MVFLKWIDYAEHGEQGIFEKTLRAPINDIVPFGAHELTEFAKRLIAQQEARES